MVEQGDIDFADYVQSALRGSTFTAEAIAVYRERCEAAARADERRKVLAEFVEWYCGEGPMVDDGTRFETFEECLERLRKEQP